MGVKGNNVRKWDQAFRIYSMTYCNANPDRAGEILQYVDIIHTAAASYSWDNVAVYDFTFRQLMAAKLWHSWAKTYTQGWNIALKSSGSKESYNGSGESKGNGSSVTVFNRLLG